MLASPELSLRVRQARWKLFLCASIPCDMPLPADLLAAASHQEGGKWVLVIGAGSSVEPPTSLPTGAQCSIEAHRRLRADGVLPADCPNPWDLSEVADAVFAITGSQAAIVQRLPINRFRTATANTGHVIAAVLLVEGSLAGVVTLNFDEAMSAALSVVSSGDAVAVIGGPDDIPNLASVNLVYLHRNAQAPFDEWVLRSAYLTSVWNDRWEPVIAQRILVAPMVVFAGLGSPAATLTQTIGLIRQALPGDTVRFYQVDVAAFGTLAFTAALSIPEAQYLQMGWCDFMSAVATRVLEEHWSAFEQACVTTAADNGYGASDMQGVAAACRTLGLVGFGAARARWLLLDGHYARVGVIDPRVVADVLLTAQFLAARVGGAMSLRDDGAMELRDGARLIATVGLASGGGVRTLIAAEAAIATHRKYWRWNGAVPQCIVVSGHLPSLTPTTPASIVAEVDENDIIGTSGPPEVISAYALRTSPALLAGMSQ